METTRKRERRRDRLARTLAQQAMREAGKAVDVGRALDKDPSTISHERTSRVNQIVYDCCRLMIALRQTPGCDAGAIRRALDKAFSLEDLTDADDETLLARGLWLLENEDPYQAAENTAARFGGPRYWDACGKTGSLHTELELVGLECDERRIDLLGEYEQRKAVTA